MNTAATLYNTLQGDKYIWLILGFLGLFSVLAVYSSGGAMAYKYAGGNPESYLFKQIFFICMGMVVAVACYKLHYLHYSRLAPILLAIAIPLLMYTFLYGPVINESRRWISIPWINQNFQTSDLLRWHL